MKKIILSIACLFAGFLLMAGLAAPAHALEFGVRGYFWFPDLKSNLRFDGNGVQGTEFDLKDTFGFSNKLAPSVEAFAGYGRHHFSAMYTEVGYNGTGSVTTPINFGGKSYSGNVYGDFNYRMIDVDYMYDVVSLKNVLAGFAIGAIGKVKYIEGQTKLNNAANGDTTQTFRLYMPMVGLGANLGILANILDARVKAAGMGYSGNYVYEGLADIGVTPFPFIDIRGGYKYVKFKADGLSDITTETTFQGPYVALTIGW
ncbi:MAG TPA: hypothetical protein VLZ07_05075 [Syntrophales bacterium]|nr:hypothetical protein [Syntrophales bacterium]